MFLTMDTRELRPEDEISDHTLWWIIAIAKSGKWESLSRLPNNVVCDRHAGPWTTWNKILEIRDGLAEFS